MTGITQRQREVLAAYAELYAEMGLPPTLREIADYLGVAHHKSVRDHFQALEKKGYAVTKHADRLRGGCSLTQLGWLESGYTAPVLPQKRIRSEAA